MPGTEYRPVGSHERRLGQRRRARATRYGRTKTSALRVAASIRFASPCAGFEPFVPDRALQNHQRSVFTNSP